ncbi:MAG: hypothetical protein IJZ30_01355 [Alphaproteobacteria bacterium]|nr:hypothetical protein [Alphaproteobacteria bacterium]
MIREEYLNPEFMHKFINSLCKKSGYIMYHFVFGKLTFKNLKQPILLENNHGYNMVYKFLVYQIPQKIDIQNIVDIKEIEKQIITKEIYFDILSEIFIENNNFICSFEEFPPYFRLNNQNYYGVYGQPKALKQHHSKAREASSCNDYMKSMNITAQNIFDVYLLLFNALDEKKAKFFPLRFIYDTKEEAQNAVTNALTKPLICNTFQYVTKGYTSFQIKKINNFPKLYIHNSKFPTFYTDNVLELTIPIAETVQKLAQNVSLALSSVNNTLEQLTYAIQTVMATNLSIMYEAAIAEYYSISESTPDPSLMISKPGILFKNAHTYAQNTTRPHMMIYENTLSKIVNSLHNDVTPISPKMDMYNKLHQQIKNITPETLSLDNLLEISDYFQKIIL